MQTQTKAHWYDDLTIVVILLVLFWPAGVYGLFRGSSASPSTRYLLAGFGLAIMGGLTYAFLTR